MRKAEKVKIDNEKLKQSKKEKKAIISELQKQLEAF